MSEVTPFLLIIGTNMLNDIIRLDCSKKENRIYLVKRVMKLLKLTEKPDLNTLEEASHRLGNKYGLQARYEHGTLIISVAGGYSLINCPSRYEAYCKHILYIKEYNRYENSKA